MSVFKSAFPWAVVGILALASGCEEDTGKFLDYRGLRFLSDEGKVLQFSGSDIFNKPLPCVRLTGKFNFVLPLRDLNEADLVTLGVVGRQAGFDRTVYEFEQGYIGFRLGKLEDFSFHGPEVSIATTKDGPFVSLPAPEKEIRKLFGEPSRVTSGRRPFH